MIPIEDQLRSFPTPPRHVLITAAGEIEQLRRDLAAVRAEVARLMNQNDNLLEQVEQLHAQTDRATEDEGKARAELAKLKAWPRCDDCGAELVEADPMQDKVCLLCEWKGKAGAARAEAARLRKALTSIAHEPGISCERCNAADAAMAALEER